MAHISGQGSSPEQTENEFHLGDDEVTAEYNAHGVGKPLQAAKGLSQAAGLVDKAVQKLRVARQHANRVHHDLHIMSDPFRLEQQSWGRSDLA